ncbi:hypothetical protein SDRG_00699 [Saprolegnia diclina VS20]|uniref:Myb-like domain-containing protein n=1 Tax=Saprolegnia diclina (strain VS20) TaxID=1156394 RepID=T0R5Y1_SAPDV|nr:hypothetical protein SDRG_00699 [Saprolegnia diclina VS20]EQC41840.1 hypothetical protein SDRG_00699 [Saprolegnia diclina VS20]|eukprot:XP_008604409.1 hypothetical protein SDRG_00699 [Saprolegnia diclina VS20]
MASSQRVPLLKPKGARKPTRVSIGPRPKSSQAPASQPKPATPATATDSPVPETRSRSNSIATPKAATEASHEKPSPVATPAPTPVVPPPAAKGPTRILAGGAFTPGSSFGVGSSPRGPARTAAPRRPVPIVIPSVGSEPSRVAPAKSPTPATPVLAPGTPVQKPGTQKPGTRVEKPTPVQKPGTPVQKPATPVLKPATPVLKPGTPVSKPSTPVSKPSTPVAKPAALELPADVSTNSPTTKKSKSAKSARSDKSAKKAKSSKKAKTTKTATVAKAMASTDAPNAPASMRLRSLTKPMVAAPEPVRVAAPRVETQKKAKKAKAQPSSDEPKAKRPKRPASPVEDEVIDDDHSDSGHAHFFEVVDDDDMDDAADFNYDDDDEDAPIAASIARRGRKTSRRVPKPLAIVPASQRVLDYARALLEDDEVQPKNKAKRKTVAKMAPEDVLESEDELAAEVALSKMTMGELAMTVPRGVRDDADDEDDEHDDEGTGRQARNEARPAPASGPRVEFVDGRIVVIESSLTIHEDELNVNHDSEQDDDEEKKKRRQSGGGYLVGRRTSKRWPHSETAQFYYALSQVGADFTLMSTLFPNRTRQELKIKFKNEEKVRRNLVDLALSSAARPLNANIAEMVSTILAKEAARKKKAKSGDIDDDDEEAEAEEMPLLF